MPVYSSSDADEGTAVVRGGGILRVEEVAPEIEKLLVEEGELVLAAPRESASAIEAVVAGKTEVSRQARVHGPPKTSRTTVKLMVGIM